MKHVRKYLVFPITYLILELFEELIYYKAQLIGDVHGRTAVVMVSLVFGISLLAFVLVPFFEGGLESLRKSHRRHGAMAMLTITVLLIAGLYFVYYIKMRSGMEGILPPFMLN